MEITPSVKPQADRPLAPVPAHAGYAPSPRYAERHCQVSAGIRLALIALGENPMCLRARLADDEWSICCVCHRPVRANEGGMRMRGNVSPVHFDCVNAGPGPGVGERPGTNDRVASAPGGSCQRGRIE